MTSDKLDPFRNYLCPVANFFIQHERERKFNNTRVEIESLLSRVEGANWPSMNDLDLLQEMLELCIAVSNQW